MRVTWADLTVDLPEQSGSDLLFEWRWLVPESMDLRMVSTLGDAFLESADGAIHWLDVAAAELSRVAVSMAEFDDLRQAAENSEQWFMPQLVRDLIAEGRRPGIGRCFSYKIPPSLGGVFEPSNLEESSLSAHFAGMGKIQAQVKHLPLGTAIDAVSLE